ncbi:unnamed protein product [Peniophora sp. CBMAI 1063]|nr:unnamed protein product [Peniophora sp. CBMAI 1063]
MRDAAVSLPHDAYPSHFAYDPAVAGREPSSRNDFQSEGDESDDGMPALEAVDDAVGDSVDSLSDDSDSDTESMPALEAVESGDSAGEMRGDGTPDWHGVFVQPGAALRADEYHSQGDLLFLNTALRHQVLLDEQILLDAAFKTRNLELRRVLRDRFHAAAHRSLPADCFSFRPAPCER